MFSVCCEILGEEEDEGLNSRGVDVDTQGKNRLISVKEFTGQFSITEDIYRSKIF